LTVGAAGGLYVYKNKLDSDILAVNKTILEKKGDLHVENINTWKRLDERIKISKQLMQSHIATSLLFKFLEDQTMRRIQFTALTMGPGISGFNVSIKGVTDSYATLALQADVLGSESVSKYLKNPLISDVALDDRGQVTFGINATIDPGLISYSELVNGMSTTVNPQGSTPSTGATPPPVNQ
jgi:hypothetical protein